MTLFSNKNICQDQIKGKESQSKWESLLSGVNSMGFSEASDRQ